MRGMSKSRVALGLCCLFLIYVFIHVSVANSAEEKYPSRPIKYLVGTAAGGPTDVDSRKLADFVGKVLGQDVIVDNRPGAGGALGASVLAKSKPDGYTIGTFTSGVYTSLPFFTKMDFDPLNDLAPIIQFADVYHLFLVAKDSPIKTFRDFLEEGRKRQLLIGVTGMTFSDIMVLYLGDLAKLNLKEVPFGGAAPCATALLGGQVDVVVNTGLIEYVRAGKMRAIARFYGEPMKEYREIPHVREFGYDVNAPGFIGVYVPKGLPKDVHAKLEEAFTRAIHDPSIIEFINKTGDVATFRNSRDFGTFLKESHERAGRLMKELGLGMFAKEKK
jgi:tripartite-type tricarboxylate transporter receptor subunit TctC